MSDFWKNLGLSDRNNGSGDLTKTSTGHNMSADQINQYKQGYGNS
jgi:hypothetical protein